MVKRRTATAQVDLDLGIAAFGAMPPSVECHVHETGVGKHPEPVGGDGVGYQAGHIGMRYPLVEGALSVRNR